MDTEILNNKMTICKKQRLDKQNYCIILKARKITKRQYDERICKTDHYRHNQEI